MSEPETFDRRYRKRDGITVHRRDRETAVGPRGRGFGRASGPPARRLYVVLLRVPRPLHTMGLGIRRPAAPMCCLSASAERAHQIVAFERAGHAFMRRADEDAFHGPIIPADTGAACKTLMDSERRKNSQASSDVGARQLARF